MTILDALDHEWHQPTLRRQLRRRYPTWAARQPVLAAAPDAHTLVADLRDRAARDTDQSLAALLTIGADDDLAGRVVLQALLPGLKALAARHAPRIEDLDAVVAAAAWSQIRRYNPQRRRQCVAVNILAGTSREVRRHHEPASVDPPVHSSAVNPAEELHDLIVNAVIDARLRPGEAQLILRTRVLGIDLATLAAEADRPVNTISRRRARAERRLRGAA